MQRILRINIGMYVLTAHGQCVNVQESLQAISAQFSNAPRTHIQAYLNQLMCIQCTRAHL